MTCNKMIWFYFAQFRFFLHTSLACIWTTCRKTAARLRIDRRCQLAFQDHPLFFHMHVRNRDRRKQRLRIWMDRIFKDFVGRTFFDQLSKIHHRNIIGNMLYNRHIVRDEHISQSPLLLQILKQIQNLSLNRHIQRGNRLITYDEVRIQ